MKKHIVILLLLQFNLIYSQHVNLIDEDFNSGLPDSWTHCSANVGTSPVWLVDSGALKHASGWYYVQTSNLIKLPPVDLTRIANPFLEFDLAMAIIDTNIQLSVWQTSDTTCNTIYTNDEYWLLDSAWNFVTSYGSLESGAENAIATDTSTNKNWAPLETDYQTVSVDLSQFSNASSISFSFSADFLNHSADGVWYIDNLRIFGNPTTGVSEPSKLSSFELFPNPSNGIFQFVPKEPIQNSTLIITSITGDIIWEKVIHSASVEIDLSNSNSGIYFVTHLHESKISVQKLILQK
jgi:hypothetical protein